MDEAKGRSHSTIKGKSWCVLYVLPAKASARSRTLKSIDPLASFLELGYVWKDNSPVRPLSLPGYCFDPTTVDYSTNKDPNAADDQRIEEEARKAKEQHTHNLGKSTKQNTLLDMWKTI